MHLHGQAGALACVECHVTLELLPVIIFETFSFTFRAILCFVIFPFREYLLSACCISSHFYFYLFYTKSTIDPVVYQLLYSIHSPSIICLYFCIHSIIHLFMTVILEPDCQIIRLSFLCTQLSVQELISLSLFYLLSLSFIV